MNKQSRATSHTSSTQGEMRKAKKGSSRHLTLELVLSQGRITNKKNKELEKNFQGKLAPPRQCLKMKVIRLLSNSKGNSQNQKLTLHLQVGRRTRTRTRNLTYYLYSIEFGTLDLTQNIKISGQLSGRYVSQYQYLGQTFKTKSSNKTEV